MVSGTRVLLQWVMIFVEVGSRAAVPKGSFVRPPDRSLVSSKKRFGGSTFSVKEISCSRGLGANRPSVCSTVCLLSFSHIMGICGLNIVGDPSRWTVRSSISQSVSQLDGSLWIIGWIIAYYHG